MKRYNKLSRDTRPQDQPPNSYPFGKNGVQNFIQGSVINEPGFLPSSAVIPYTPIGIIETDRFPIIFSTNNTNSAWGFYDFEQDVYTAIFDDVAGYGFLVGFHTDNFITGTAQRNYKGELVGTFTDKVLAPFYVNFDAPDLAGITSIADLRLFPSALPPTISTEIQGGGLLVPGAYYAAVRYLVNDGTETGYLVISSPKIVEGVPGAVTDKGLEITISDIDERYDKIQVAIISKIAGVVSAVQLLNPYTIDGTGVIFYSGGEFTEAITLEEILTPMVIYDRVDTIGQLNDALYLAGLHSPEAIDMQKYANLIRMKWHSRLITVDPIHEKMRTGEEKSLLHEEVIAFYIRYKLDDGTNSDSFHIPGPALTSSNLATSVNGGLEGITAKVFQIQDTIGSFSASNKSGYFGKWQNETETYPDEEQFDSTAIGGTDLRGQPVRHHRSPSIGWCKANLYASDATYGRTRLDMLGISVENILIPAAYSSRIVGWEIFFAKRSVGNSTVLGQSLLLFGCRNKYDTQYAVTANLSSGGNWDSDVRFKSGSTERMRQYVDQSIFRFHPFDMLFNKPSVSADGNYLSLQLKHSRLDIPGTGAFIEDGHISNENDAPIVFCLDYLLGAPPQLANKRLKKVDSVQYVPNNMNLGKWNNIGLETAIGGHISNPEELVTVDWLEVAPGSRGIGDTQPEFAPQYEHTFLTNLMTVRSDLYVPFTGQALVRAANSNSVVNTSIFFGGDTYISDYSFHTYGTWVSDQKNNEEDLFKGTKVVRRFICETAANLYARFEDPANQYSRYYPKSPLKKDQNVVETNYITPFQRDIDPNQFGYTKDSNAQDDLILSSIFNPFNEKITDHPYRIHRGGKLSRQTKFRSWRTFLPLDYYEMQKNMGRPIHLEGMDDRLLIHCENALFLTQDKTTLESNILSVTLGTGDIFQFEPQEGMSAKLGYAGTQHELACVRTPFGYVFIDSKSGQIFLYKGGLALINNMLNTFFEQYLRLKEKNVFTGNGYTIGYDPKYKRILLTVKNRRLISDQEVPEFTPELLPTLDPGDLVMKNGRLQKFEGVNTLEESGYECEVDVDPTAEGFIATIPEDTAVGTAIGTVTGTDVDNFYITGDSSPFWLHPTTGVLSLVGGLDFYEEDQYIFTGVAVNDNGNTAAFSITVNITEVNRGPIVEDAEVSIPDTTATDTLIHTMVATDRENDTLTYTLLGGNIGSTFAVDSATGEVTIADATQLNGLTKPRYELIINVSDGATSATGILTVLVSHVNQPPVPIDYEITIDDNVPNNTVVLTLDPALDPENDPLTYTVVSESTPGIFSFDPDTLEFTLILNSSLNPLTLDQYTFNMSVSDGKHVPQPFTVLINLVYNRRNIAFSPINLSCSGGVPVCEDGWTLSDDGTTCTRVTLAEPDITQLESCLAESTDSVYGDYGVRIYNAGHLNSYINENPVTNGDIYAQVASGYWISKNNEIGVWVDTDCNGTKDILTALAQTTILYNYNNTGAARLIYVGVFGDNQFVLKHNDTTIASTTTTNDRNFKILHVFPVNIVNGTNIFNVVGTGDGSVNDAVGLILLDNTAAQIAAADDDTDLTILFSSEELRGTSTTIATCPTGYVLDFEEGSPVCKFIENEAPTITPSTTATWATVQVWDTKRDEFINSFLNDGAPHTFQDLDVPYYPPIDDHVSCDGTVTSYYSAQKLSTAQKVDCEEGVGSVVEYVVPAGIYRTVSTQFAADLLAQTDVNNNKQAYANEHGVCQ